MDITIFYLSCFLSFFPQLWETAKVHTSSAVCLKRDSDVLLDQEEIIISAADNCNRLQVRLEGAGRYRRLIRSSYALSCVCVS